MLQLHIDDFEGFDEDRQEFVNLSRQTIVLEHSLLSVSKWESKWKKPFFTDKKTEAEFMDYIRCMTITSKVDPLVYHCLTEDHIKLVKKYIEDPMTGTTIKENHVTPRRNRTLTSEVIYCWMFTQNIPIECEKWHLNRLLTLIRVCNIENNPKRKKMSRNEIYNQNAALNAARKAKYGTRG